MTTTSTGFQVFLTNLGKYNEGELMGEWIALPIDEAELDEVLERIGIDGERYEETFITDYENDFGYRVGEWDNIRELNEVAEAIQEADDPELIKALLSDGFTLEDALNEADNCIIWEDCENMTDVAYAVCEATGLLDSIPENLQYYFDYEAYGRDLDLEGRFIFTDGGDCIEVC